MCTAYPVAEEIKSFEYFFSKYALPSGSKSAIGDTFAVVVSDTLHCAADVFDVNEVPVS